MFFWLRLEKVWDQVLHPKTMIIFFFSNTAGGVGKSTTAVNLALSLSKLSRGGVGILDADVFGPSIPIMLHLEGKPGVTSDKKMVPLTNYGLQCMSMGFLVDPEQGKKTVGAGVSFKKKLVRSCFVPLT